MAEKKYFFVVILLLISFTSCAKSQLLVQPPILPATAPQRESDALIKAVETYYTAPDAVSMRNAVNAARKAGPDTALYHEIAANLAYLEDRRSDRFTHLYTSLLDPDNDTPLLHLHLLSKMSLTLKERMKMEQLCEALQHHPDHEVKSLANYLLRISLFVRGEMKRIKKTTASIDWNIPLALIGTWDNDQNKGFDISYPPEQEIDMNKTYKGQLVEIGWRTQYPKALSTNTINLKELLHPNVWAVGYLASVIHVTKEGSYELRLSSTDAIKVWVNNILVFENRHISQWTFDGIIIPVMLSSGANRILIKSAQDKDGWKLSARLTRPGGIPVDPHMLKTLPADTPCPIDTEKMMQPLDPDRLLDRFTTKVENEVRRQFLLIRSARLLGLKISAVRLAETFTNTFPTSLTGRFLLAFALWDNAERGRTADLLGVLVQEAGDQLIQISNKQARFWHQNNLTQKARQLLFTTTTTHPNRPTAWRSLVSIYKEGKWKEDALNTLKVMARQWPDWPSVQVQLANALEGLGYQKPAESIYRQLLSHLPNDHLILQSMFRISCSKQNYAAAKNHAQQLTDLWPHLRSSWWRLGEILRQLNDRHGAEKAFLTLIEMAPTAPDGYHLYAGQAYLYGDRDKAIRFWQKALDRDPDNEQLANRLDFIAPPVSGPWAKDVPDQETIKKAVASRSNILFHSGADTALLLDDMVTELKRDGSSVNVITAVTHILNKSGRDQMTKYTLPKSGRSRILQAYLVDPEGKRVEASSIRGKTIRLRKMKIGSTVVVQFRHDAPPNKYLVQYYANTWWFQQYKTQIFNSRFVLWTPEDSKTLEFFRGNIKRQTQRKGNFIRLAWSTSESPVLIPESRSPHISDIAWVLKISTVPTWDLFHKWEEALLQNVFRESPEIVQLANTLFKGADTSIEKLHRIQTFLMTEIRYQKDYEYIITGVKPHAAPVVLARRYGDCKDKAVLFITLARLGGIEAQFALIRSRHFGQIRKKVPMQQFNHVIVYIPPQPGINEGKFFDPTVDALDVSHLRPDNQGTWAFVLDLKGGYAWKHIPFQTAEIDYLKKQIVMNIKKNGNCNAEVVITAEGRNGAVIRRIARNKENFTQFLQHILSNFIPGAKMIDYQTIEIADVRRPAKIKINFDAPTFVRREGNELRFKIPKDWHPKNLFSLARRNHPLVFGVPSTQHLEIDFIFPEGIELKQAPDSKEVMTDCLSLKRSFLTKKRSVNMRQSFSTFCERIPSEDYPTLRNEIDKIIQLQEEEVVLTVL
jgi:tetratricopeptide (TPR) repeat protein